MERIKRKNAVAEKGNNFFLPSVIGGAVGLGIALLLMLVLPFAVLGLDDPDSFVLPSVCICVFIGSAVGGFLNATKNGDMPLVSAITAFSAMMLPIILISFFVSGEISIASIFAVLLSAAAGIASVTLAVTRFSKSKKRKMKNVMKRR